MSETTVEKTIAYKGETIAISKTEGYWGTTYGYETSVGARGSGQTSVSQAADAAKDAIDRSKG